MVATDAVAAATATTAAAWVSVGRQVPVACNAKADAARPPTVPATRVTVLLRLIMPLRLQKIAARASQARKHPYDSPPAPHAAQAAGNPATN
jgi:hypothetical protein